MKYTILVIDDDETMRSLLTDILEPFGFSVQTAATAEQGIQSASETRPDVILCDLILPDALGSEAAMRLRANAETKNVPIILVTGYPYLERVVEKLNCAFVTKPFSISRMVEMVHEVLGIQSELNPVPAH